MRAKSIFGASALIWALGGGAAALADEGAALRERTFEAVWRQVNESYYDAAFVEEEWPEIGERYRQRLPRIESMDALRQLLGEMLFELGESHVGILGASYDEASSIRPWGGGWAGVDLCLDGRQVVVFRLEEGGAAEAAGLRLGDRIESVGGRAARRTLRQARRSGLPAHLARFSALQAVQSQFNGRPGERIVVQARSPGGKRREANVELRAYEGRLTEPLGNIAAMPLAVETRRLENGIAYLRFNLWFPAAMGEIRSFARRLDAGTPGLIIDLRGNPGGVGLMAGGLAGMLVDEQLELGRTTLREGHINFVGFPQRGAFVGKVAILVDEGSASTSEIFAIGLQEAGRARVFGQPTPGAALPSIVTELPNGDFLQVALGDFRTPGGASLEGHGVQPDAIVSISPVDLSRGIDRVIESASEWILNSNPH